eukprot:NODE_17_length_48642_cov_1.199349.p38 type:complete len:138 gc:universal NODE_17_length_48642_cov_1.199349:934-1347(+)
MSASSSIQLSSFGHIRDFSQNIFQYIHDDDILVFISSVRKIQKCRIRVKEELLIEILGDKSIYHDSSNYVYLECDISNSRNGYKLSFHSVSIYFQIMLFLHTSAECFFAILKLLYTIGYIGLDVMKGFAGFKLVYVK